MCDAVPEHDLLDAHVMHIDTADHGPEEVPEDFRIYDGSQIAVNDVIIIVQMMGQKETGRRLEEGGLVRDRREFGRPQVL